MQRYHVPRNIASRFPDGTTLVGLDEVKTLHTTLAKAREAGELGQTEAGYEALRWSRRVLRQSGGLVGTLAGKVLVPEILDLRLGPDILVGATTKSVRDVADALEDEACIVPAGESTAVFLPVDADLVKGCQVCIEGDQYDCEPIELPWSLDFRKGTFLTTSTTKLRTLAKSATSYVGATAYQIQGEVLGYVEPILLRFHDRPRQDFELLKVDESLGLVLGWGIICKTSGEDYVDLQGEHIPEDVMFRGAVDFMKNSQMLGEMHERVPNPEDPTSKQPVWKGQVVFAWPMTTEVAKAYGITTSTTGLMVAVAPDSPEVLDKFRKGEYTGFSIGGRKVVEEV